MIRLIFALWFALPLMAAAAPVVVKSGEHDGFTRLVLEYQRPVDWQVGRTDDGYVLRIANDTPLYDLSETFKVIGKSRLAGISADANSGALNLAIACACFAIPFEFRPGIVVIDLRDGKPPKGSSFEEPLAPAEGESSEVSETSTAPGPRYNWQAAALEQLRGGAPPLNPTRSFAPPSNIDPSLQPLREALLHQISRGAAQGVVDMAKLQHEASPPILPKTGIDTARIGLGELPGLSMSNGLPDHQELNAEGAGCIESERLDVASWGDDSPIFEQIANYNAHLIGEFDRPDPKALQHAVQFQIFIGFGAEASQLLRAFPNVLPDAELFQSMAQLVDGRADQHSAFIGQESCDSRSALWAILAQPDLTASQHVNTNAAFLAFSGLPIGLRRDLGPVLADRFMMIGANDAAARVRDAILRAPGGAGPDASLLSAKIELHQGDAAKAEATLEQMVADSGPGTSAALVAMVDARIAQDLPIAPDMVAALEAIVIEQSGSAAAPAAIRALLLAKAASGDMDGAFALLSEVSEAEPQLWRILSFLGTDDAILAHAVREPEAPSPNLSGETAAKLAERLLNLGMADSALHWIPDESQADPVLLARIQIQRHDGRAALRALTGQDSAAALQLRATAMQQLGDDAAAAQIYAQADARADEQRAMGNAGDWAGIASHGTGPWQQLASQLPPRSQPEAVPTVETGPLAAGQQIIDRSTATRESIAALLNQVAAP